MTAAEAAALWAAAVVRAAEADEAEAAAWAGAAGGDQ